MYGLHLIDESADVYSRNPVDERLNIKTHYEKLDIAQSKKIFYLNFCIPAQLPEKDIALQEFLKETEQSPLNFV